MAATANTGLARKRGTLRRGTIAALVVLSVVIFTAYFRESNSGPLHGLQDGAARAVTPVQSVSADALAPVRDSWDWLVDLRDARGRADRLERENAMLQAQAIENRAQAEEVERLRGLAGVGGGLAADYDRVGGEVVGRSVTNWYRGARINVGSEKGIVVNSPVLALGDDGRAPAGALAGVVATVRNGSSDVRFLTDGRTEVGATVQEAGSPPGLLRSTTPGQLQLSGVPREFPVREGQAVLTAGFSGMGLPSVYPRGIPIGRVTGVGLREVDVQQTVQVTPFVDPRSLRYVVVLAPTSDDARRRAVG